MQIYNLVFRIQLRVLVLSHTNNFLYSAIRTRHVIELSKLKKVFFSTFQGMREEASLRRFFEKLRESA